MPVLAKNKKALFDYEILERFEAGIVLRGHEVKSVKAGHISLKGAYVSQRGKELFLIAAHISKYKPAGPLLDHDTERERKLLLRKSETERLLGKITEKGLTIVPLSVYTKGNLIKVEIGIARGKKAHDKRESIKKRDVERDMRRAMKNY